MNVFCIITVVQTSFQGIPRKSELLSDTKYYQDPSIHIPLIRRASYDIHLVTQQYDLGVC